MSSYYQNIDLCVIGGGSAGIGAALAAARAGLSVVLLDKADRLGGNAVSGGVHNWEPGVGGAAFPREIFERLRRIPQAAGVWSLGRHCCFPDRNFPPFPGAELLIDHERTYDDTLQRYGTDGFAKDLEIVRRQWHGVVFESDAYAKVVEDMLLETGRCKVWKQTAFVGAAARDGKVLEIRIVRAGRATALSARLFIDATADALLCSSVGCKGMIGEDAKSLFEEPHAPARANPKKINAVTLVYRVKRAASPRIEPLPPGISGNCWFGDQWSMASIGQYPCGDRNINMLPTMEGREFLEFLERPGDGYRQAYEECHRRILGHWHFLQTEFPEFRMYRLSWVAPALGVRESRRVIGEYILTEHDLLAGLSRQDHEDIVAIADHALDIHGDGNQGCPELSEPYGIPLRCLIPKGWRNLLVAGRCASFSHLAASSCRLSRTMMDLGHAAGLAASMAAALRNDVSQVDPSELRRKLIIQGTCLQISPGDSKMPGHAFSASDIAPAVHRT